MTVDQSKRIRLTLLVGLCVAVLVLIGHLALAAPPTDDSNNDVAEGGFESPRGKFTLLKLFDFARYKQLFKKSYASLAEQAIRQKLYLARAARAVISGIKYKYGLASEYLKVNSRSDWTKEEIATSKLRNVKLFANVPGAYANIQPPPVTTVPPIDGDKPLEMVDAEQIESQLKEIAEGQKVEPGLAKIMDELNNGGARRRRQVEKVHEISTSDLVGDTQVHEPPEVEKKIVRVPKSNNPTYQPPEMASFADINSDEDSNEPLKPTSSMKTINYYTVISQDQREQTGEALKSIFSDLAKTLFGSRGSSSDESQRNNDQQQQANKEKQVSDKPNEVYVDHRDSNCFFSPRNQGDCGSCYAFAMIAQLEWMHCRETGKLVPFSEQYIIDCGGRTGLKGCDGGDVSRLAEFANNFGVELRTMYPYKGQLDVCPYDEKTEPEKMGYMKLNIGKTAIVPQNSFGEFIKYSPMIVGVSTKNTNFEEYGGGVSSGSGCGVDEDHAMLLVGHGREDGEEYWLLRNSHSVDFGEEGYYKLSKKAPCIRTSGFIFGSVDGRTIKMSPQINELHNEQLVKERGSAASS